MMGMTKTRRRDIYYYIDFLLLLMLVFFFFFFLLGEFFPTTHSLPGKKNESTTRRSLALGLRIEHISRKTRVLVLRNSKKQSLFYF